MEETNINYIDTVFSCIEENSIVCEDMIADHMMVYVISGKLILQVPEESITLKNRKAFFLRRNPSVKLIQQPGRSGVPFKAIFFHLNTTFLKSLAFQVSIPIVEADSITRNAPQILLPYHPFLDDLFASLELYFDIRQYPSKELVEARLSEALLALLEKQPELGSMLFDFLDPWRPNLVEFMENNFACDLTAEGFAHYARRNFTDFKREFISIYQETPSRWIVKRRLEAAYKLLASKKCTPINVFSQVGFKNRAHFSGAFKRLFGITPSQVK